MRLCDDYFTHYRVESGMPDRIIQKIDKILTASSPEEGRLFSTKALDSAHLQCLYSWGKGDADGPRNSSYLEKQARKAESLANMLEKKCEYEAAAKQRQRALALRDEANNGK